MTEKPWRLGAEMILGIEFCLSHAWQGCPFKEFAHLVIFCTSFKNGDRKSDYNGGGRLYISVANEPSYLNLTITLGLQN